MARILAAVVVGLVSSWGGVWSAAAQGPLTTSTSPPTTAVAAGEPFAAPAALPDPRTAERLLFLPLSPAFARCVGLTSPCPADSSSLLLVPVQGKRVVWQVEGTQLPEVTAKTPPLRAVGTGPASPDDGRYLVPAVDGIEGGLVFLSRRYDGGYLVEMESSAEGRLDTYVPSIVGPRLSTATPSATPIGPLFDQPVSIPPEALTDATAVFVARRASPSRVAFGVRADPAWGLNQEYIPLVDARGLALVGRFGGDVGLAVAAPVDLTVEPSSVTTALADRRPNGDRRRSDDEDGRTSTVVAGAAAGLVTLAGIILVARRRRSSR